MAKPKTKALPLEQQQLLWTDRDGNKLKIPAIDKRWCEDLDMGNYSALKCSVDVVMETWMQHAERLNDALEFLLHTDCHVFWSHIIFDEGLNGSLDPTASVLAALENYLRLCPRYTDSDLMQRMLTKKARMEVRQLGKEIHSNFLLLICRLATHKESNEKYMTKSFYAEKMYDKELFPIPRLMDICSVYGMDNGTLLRGLCDFLFKVQPSLVKDLKDNLNVLHELLDRCEETLTLNINSGPKLGTRYGLDQKTKDVVVSTVLCAVDVIHTLHCLLLCVPFVGPMLCDLGLAARLTQFCEVVFTYGMQGIEEHVSSFSGQYQHLRGRLVYFHRTTLTFIRELVVQSYISPFVDEKKGLDQATSEERLRKFGKFLLAMVKNQQFACLYNNRYPFEEDWCQLAKFGWELPRELEQAVLKEFKKAKADVGLAAKLRIYKKCPKLDNPISEIPQEKRQKIEIIKETVFPRYSDAFFRVLFIHMNWNSEAVVDALLQQKLPRDLELYRLIAEQEEELRERFLLIRGKKASIPAKFLQKLAAQASQDPDAQSEPSEKVKDHEDPGSKEIEAKMESVKIEQEKKQQDVSATERHRLGQELMDVHEKDERQYEDEYDDTYEDAASAVEGADLFRNRKVRRPSKIGFQARELPISESMDKPTFCGFENAKDEGGFNSVKFRTSDKPGRTLPKFSKKKRTK